MLALSWLWCLAVVAAGVAEVVEQAGARERRATLLESRPPGTAWIRWYSGRLELIDADPSVIGRLPEVGSRLATTDEVAGEALTERQRGPWSETLGFMLLFALVPPLGLLGGRCWWRWVRVPEAS